MTDQPSSDALTSALRLLEAGRAPEAVAALEGVLAAAPDRAEARLALGRAKSAMGDFDAARAAFDAVLTKLPKQPELWLELALSEARAGRGADLARRARKADLPPLLVEMVNGAASGQGARALGLGAADKKEMAALAKARPAEAEAMLVRLSKAKPAARLLLLLGRARLGRGAFRPAAEAFGAGLKLEPYAADLRLGLARALARGGQGLQALGQARKACEHAPTWAEAQVVFARLALAHGLIDRAADAADAALAAAPRADAALAVAADVALARGERDRAAKLSEKRKPGAPGRAMALARAAGDDSEAALRHFATAIGDAPDDPGPRVARAQLLQSLGRLPEAEAELTEVLARRPSHGLAARALAYATRLAPDDPRVAAMDAARLAKDTSEDDRRLLDYALARVQERADPAASFAHLARANAATAARFPHDAASDAAELDDLLGPLRTALDAVDGTSDSDAAPIFVTGLPRSGTTLVETILAAHPAVRAGGELGVLQRAVAGLEARLRAGDASADDLSAAAEAYGHAAGLDRAPRLTDKSIHSFTRIGLIRRILPKARIVVVHRDPRDTGLSIWRNHFPDGSHRYAATWEGIADHVGLFDRAVRTWREVLPDGAFHEIHYEALLDDPEGQARAMLAACDLDWTEDVLAFHEKAGRVDTLSFAQVRQPLYTSSRGGWRDHADHIAPLLEALAARGVLPD